MGEAQAAPTAAALVAHWVSDGLLSGVTLAATGRTATHRTHGERRSEEQGFFALASPVLASL
jgi:hypothetical protein